MSTKLSDYPHSFYIFSEKVGNKEGNEPDKILFAYPSTRLLDEQLKVVGLAEAFLRFYGTFTSVGSYRVLKTVEGRMALFSPEESIWLCLSFKFPAVRPEDESVSRSSTVVFKPGCFFSDSVLLALLKNFYNLWKLHCGSIQTYFSDENGLDECRNKLKTFFNTLLHLANECNWSLMDIFQGISYMPLERLSYLKVFNIVNRLECSFIEVSSTVIFYSNCLIWSGLNQDDTSLMFTYVSKILHQSDSASEDRRQFQKGSFIQPVYGDSGILMKAYLSSYPSDEPVSLVIFGISAFTVITVIEDDSKATPAFLNMLSEFLSETFLILAPEMNRISLTNFRDEPSFKFIYYNTSNCALKSTVHDLNGKLVEKSTISSDAMTKMLLLSDNLRDLEPVELATSVSNDTWVVLKKTAQRQLFLIVTRQRGTCTLIHVTDELRKLSSWAFSDILFLDI